MASQVMHAVNRVFEQWRRAILWSMIVASEFFFSSPTFGADTRSLLAQWLSAQTNLQTWSADVTQTRSLKTLTQPLTARGRVWFAAPNRFRWELLEPSP